MQQLAIVHVEQTERGTELGPSEAAHLRAILARFGEVTVGRDDAGDSGADRAGGCHQTAGEVRLVIRVRPDGDDVAE
jgi:hypothetical protein